MLGVGLSLTDNLTLQKGVSSMAGTATLATSLKSAAGYDFHPSQAVAVIDRRAGLPAYTRDLILDIIGMIRKWSKLADIPPVVVMAQVIHETNGFRFTGDVKFDQFNFGGIGATGGGEPGASNPDPEYGVIQVIVHHLAYIYGDVPDWPEHIAGRFAGYVGHDPRFDAVISSPPRSGQVATIGDYTNGRWAYSSKYPLWTLQNGYARSLVLIANDILDEPVEPGIDQGPTGRMVAALRDQGFEVHDVRGRLPVNPNPEYRYGTIPLSQVRYVIQHWTGDRFTRETIKAITGTDYGVDYITPLMTVDDEIDMLRWYANYHIGLDGGTWGGIAYGTLVFPSGRIYVAWDIGTLTYHAFDANRQSYAVAAPLANWAEPTPATIRGLFAIWDILNAAPEIDVTPERFLGHKEAIILDGRNQTACPGTVLPHLAAWRNGLEPPIVDDGRRYFGNHVPYYVHGGFRAYFEHLESLRLPGGTPVVWPDLGYPLSNEFQINVDDGRFTVQVFERGGLIWKPGSGLDWDVTRMTNWQYIQAIRQGIKGEHVDMSRIGFNPWNVFEDDDAPATARVDTL